MLDLPRRAAYARAHQPRRSRFQPGRIRKKDRVMISDCFRATALVISILLGPAVAAFAQATSTIAGTVTDTTGAVMPGVTVEARSPVLIEQVKTVVTDGKGEYRII